MTLRVLVWLAKKKESSAALAVSMNQVFSKLSDHFLRGRKLSHKNDRKGGETRENCRHNAP